MGTCDWNLDLWAAETGRRILEQAKPESKKEVNGLQSTLTKALGILQESGIYAFFLYLLAKREKKDAKAKNDPCRVILKQVLEDFGQKKDRFGFSGEAPVLPDSPNTKAVEKILNWVAKEIAADLPRLLLCREFLQRALTYALYAAEAKEVELNHQTGGSQP
ncbi:hypothetical protein [Ammonifex thiophilus]|uniref:CRISPR type III-B/RAMP module-associated protein Cmr5 n=1 Tax=Ammonifex thiophilus TaxID=444093 RepID=A0A3D8P3B3_9THEO|nr:hypothetical protein [Ammonifex thiophilus]RDV81260.1 hypothetical protein DXX99_09470 [Ammonifex thiophilus]